MASGETRQYKHITWRQARYQSGWLVQLHGKTIGGFHSSQEAAAETLRKACGLKRKNQLEVAELPRAPSLRSAFAGVSYHKQSRRFWVYDVAGLGMHRTAQQAAQARSSALGMDKLKKKRTSAQEMIDRLNLLQKVYLPKCGQWKMFADLHSAFKHVKTSQAMFAAEPAFEMISIQLKYDPWRNALLDAWRQRGKPAAECVPDLRSAFSFEDKGLHARASRLHSVLMLTIKIMFKTKVAEAWPANCSRFVGRHSAPEVVLHHLGLLIREASREDGAWVPARSKDDVETSTQRLMKVIWAWTVIRNEIRKAPRSCLEWVNLQQYAFKELRKLKMDIPRLPVRGDDYVRMWTVRTLMLMLMSKEGVQKLVVDRKLTAWKFCQMCPDQKLHLRKLYYHVRPQSVRDFLKKCGFRDGPPELFSCMTCFAGDMAWDYLQRSQFDVELWNKAVCAYHRKHGMFPIPAVIIKELRDQGEFDEVAAGRDA